MAPVWSLAALWVALALAATLAAIWLRVSTALSEIIVGVLAQFLIAAAWPGHAHLLAPDTPWIAFLAGAGAIVLTFLAGAELDPEVLRSKGREALIIGMAGFTAPFLGCFAVARFLLHWSLAASWLAGVALSTTSVAVVYAVLLEMGFNVTEFGKAILASCFVNDIGTVIALGLIFAPFTLRTVVFVAATAAALAGLPWLTPRLFRRFGGRVSELETKFLLLALFTLGALASWAGSEPVLPAYLIGMILAGTVGRDAALIRRLRTATFGFLTPFYFIRAGTFVSLPALAAAPLVFLALFAGKMVSKLAGTFPAIHAHRYEGNERMYYVLMMSTGLTFGTISSLYGLSHHIIGIGQYSFLVATVIASAVIPTLVANGVFLPRHLLSEPAAARRFADGTPISAEGE